MITATVSNFTTSSTPNPDYLDRILAENAGQDEILATYIPSVLEDIPFSVDIEFFKWYPDPSLGEGVLADFPVLAVTANGPTMIVDVLKEGYSEPMLGDVIDGTTVTEANLEQMQDYVHEQVVENTGFSSIGMTVTPLTASKIRISGQATNVFTGSFYRFLLKGYETNSQTAILPPTTPKSEWAALVQYKPPGNSYTLIDLDFTLTCPEDPLGSDVEHDEDYTMHQYVHWSYVSAEANVRNFSAQGDI